MIVPDVKPILNPYLAMTSEKYLKEVTVGPVSALSGKVVLEEYDAAWKGIFEEEKDACETMPRPAAYSRETSSSSRFRTTRSVPCLYFWK